MSSPEGRLRRVVAVTGLGTVNALGRNCREFWDSLMAGRSGAAPVQSFDTGKCRTHAGVEIRFDLPETCHPSRLLNLAAAAGREALNQAGGTLPRDRTAVVLGTLQGGVSTLENAAPPAGATEPRWAECYGRYCPSGLSRYLAAHFGFQGPVSTSIVACAASGAAISRAADLIRLNVVDAALAGGADSYCMANFAVFNVLRSLAPDVCRPFALGRQGLLIGEGAGLLVLEAWETAAARGAQPLAFLLGSGLSDDGYHITAPDPAGWGAVRAMQAALADAGLGPQAIDYVNAHGTGTPSNDSMETRALLDVFGERARALPVSSIKGAVGHCMGAAGGIESVASVMTLREQVLPATLNWIPGDPDCTLDYVPNQPRPAAVTTLLKNSFGFAGNNASLIFSLTPGSGQGSSR